MVDKTKQPNLYHIVNKRRRYYTQLHFVFSDTQKEERSTLSEPDESTQVNSTKLDRSKDMKQKIEESTIRERSFDSTFDESFILRMKPVEGTEESGFQSGNHTFDFTEDENVVRTGIQDLIQREKEGCFGGGFFGKKTFFDFKILERKVSQNQFNIR